MKKSSVQEHHISKDPEVTLYVYKGEHAVLTRMQWYCSKRPPSRGFITALKVWLALHESDAVDLQEMKQ